MIMPDSHVERQEVLEQLIHTLHAHPQQTTAAQFQEALKFIDNDTRCALYKNIEKKLPQLVKSINDYRHIFDTLPWDESHAFYHKMKKKLVPLVQNADDLCAILITLTDDERTVFLNMISKKLGSILSSPAEVKKVLYEIYRQSNEHLHAPIVLTALKSQWPKLINTDQELDDILTYLPPEACEALCHLLTERLPQLLDTSKAVYTTLMHLDPRGTEFLLHVIQHTITTLILTADDFEKILASLHDQEQRSMIYKLMPLLPLIQSAEHLKSILIYLTPEERHHVFQSIRAMLPDLLTSKEEIILLQPYLSEADTQDLMMVQHLLEPLTHMTTPAQAKAFTRALMDPNEHAIGAHLDDLLQIMHAQSSTHLFFKPDRKKQFFELLTTLQPIYMHKIEQAMENTDAAWELQQHLSHG